MKRHPPRQTYAKKSLGQNFLADSRAIERIIEALEIEEGDELIEIGPGRGALTKPLLDSGARLSAIEIDRELIPLLSDTFKEYETFSIFEEDALQADFSRFAPRMPGKKLKLAANLPYYISTAILQKLIADRELFSRFVLMLQKEVADRITAKPGGPERGFLSVMVEAYCEAGKLFDLPPQSFRPMPKVWSSVVCLKVRSDPGIENEEGFRKAASLGFMQRRKTILNNLKKGFPNALEALEVSGILPGRRAEALTIDEWKALAINLA